MLCQLEDDDDSIAESLSNADGSGAQAPCRSQLNSMICSQKSKWKVVVCKHDGISAADPSWFDLNFFPHWTFLSRRMCPKFFHCSIFLVDHAWTFQSHDARKHLTEIPGLLERMCQLVDIESDGEKREDLINSVLDKIWHFCQTYSVQSEDLVS